MLNYSALSYSGTWSLRHPGIIGLVAEGNPLARGVVSGLDGDLINRIFPTIWVEPVDGENDLRTGG